MSEVRCVWPLAAQLGEGPIWVQGENALYFVDIAGCSIHRWREDGGCHAWQTPAEVGFAVPRAGGGFICGLNCALFHFDPITGSCVPLISLDLKREHHRINDGFVDGSGRLWFGTMDTDARTASGALYSLEAGLTLRIRDSGYHVANGPAMDPQGRILYHTDSATRTVYAFNVTPDGSLSDKRPFICFPKGVYPDGMAVDNAGGLWIALFNGWRVEHYSPSAQKLGEIRFPCANVTKPAFGGSQLRTLYVTTAWFGLSPEDRRKQPLAGGLFAVDVDAQGLLQPEVIASAGTQHQNVTVRSTP